MTNVCVKKHTGSMARGAVQLRIVSTSTMRRH